MSHGVGSSISSDPVGYHPMRDDGTPDTTKVTFFKQHVASATTTKSSSDLKAHLVDDSPTLASALAKLVGGDLSGLGR